METKKENRGNVKGKKEASKSKERVRKKEEVCKYRVKK